MEKLTGDARVHVRVAGLPDSSGQTVVYWMRRAQRAHDNPALETAVAAANMLDKPLVVYFALSTSIPRANARHYGFMADGLHDAARDLNARGIGFVLRRSPDHGVARFCADVSACLLVSDENPLREAERHVRRLASRLGIPFWTVDADVVVPTRLLAKEHYAARTIRPRIREQLDLYLKPITRRKPKRVWRAPVKLACTPLQSEWLRDLHLDRSVGAVPGLRGGSSAARRALRSFVRNRLPGYASNRNHPELDGTSRLSPFLHFGHIGPRTVALAVQAAAAPEQDKASFLEEFIVRRELAVNFVHFNPRYDTLACCEPWARKTLDAHARDERRYVYTREQLRDAETHDPLWNAAQKQMLLSGWMHGYVRMYWAKKILEWSPSPAEAFDAAVSLNDRFELDGRDPNGYAGVAWAIGGKHDRAWPERPIFGKIRYMSFDSTSRKFASKAFMQQVRNLETHGP